VIFIVPLILSLFFMRIPRIVPIALLTLLLPALRAAGQCCGAAKPGAAAPTAALSDRSIYQLDAVWTDDAGRPFKLTELRGQPVVLAMFFTSCGYACPRIVADLGRIRQTLSPEARARVRFVLVSFDDQRDTAPVLRAYRELHELPAGGWVLLHGTPDAIRELAGVLGVQYRRDGAGLFEHSNLITVLNAAGEIVHQRSGLEGGLAEAARAVTAAMPGSS
jgi:protein SCO1/2